MKTNYMLEYNKLFDKIVKEFGTRFYKEAFDEEFNINDIDIIDYQGYKHILIICDEYYSLENMLFTLNFNIPIKILRDFYNESLEAYMVGKELSVNFYNYWLRSKNNEKYYEDELESLKQSEEKVKEIKQELEKAIKSHK